jgi:hypothetical protein
MLARVGDLPRSACPNRSIPRTINPRTISHT